MKISKTAVLGLWWIFATLSLWLMVVNAAEKTLTMDLKNAVQHFKTVRLITGSDNSWVDLNRINGPLLEISWANNFIITTWGTVSTEINEISWVRKSSILWWKGNKIKNGWGGGNYDVILWWEGNELDWSDKNYFNVILWWKGNKIHNSTHSIVLWWEGNIVNNNSVYATTIWNKNIMNSSYSIAIWTNNTVNGSYSVAAWSNWIVGGGNSFLWTNKKLSVNDGDLFVVNWENGMVVNANKAHSFAKLTIWWSLVIGTKDVSGWEGWMIKVIDNNWRKCFCSHNGSGRNSLHGGGSCAPVCDGTQNNPECSTSADITCNWKVFNVENGCEIWSVLAGTGAFFIDNGNYIHWACQSENGNVTTSISVDCKQKIDDGSCGSVKPEAQCSSTKNECTKWDFVVWSDRDDENNWYWKCKYGAESIKDCSTSKQKRSGVCTNPSLPAGTWEWVNGHFTQTWNGTVWTPASHLPTYDPTGSSECSFKCSGTRQYIGGVCKEPSYTCGIWDNPQWAWVRTWSSTYLTGTYTPNKWTYAAVDPSALKPCQWTCESTYEKNGNGCKLKSTSYTCGTWDNPQWAWVAKWSSTYLTGTYTPNKWTYAAVDPSALKPCQWTCDTNYTKNWNGCKKADNRTCSNPIRKYKCSDWSDGTKTWNNWVSEDWSKLTWDCWESSCRMCNEDKEYVNIWGECVKCLWWYQEWTTCIVDLDCEKNYWSNYVQVGNECLPYGSCHDSSNHYSTFESYTRAYGSFEQSEKEVLPINKNWQWSCKDNKSQVTLNACEFSCPSWTSCSYNNDKCIRNKYCYMDPYNFDNFSDYTTSLVWRNATSSGQPYVEVSSEQALLSKKNSNAPWCYVYCKPGYTFDGFSSCRLNYHCTYAVDIWTNYFWDKYWWDPYNGSASQMYGGVPTQESQNRTYVTPDKYEDERTRSACLWTCNEWIPVHLSTTSPFTSVFDYYGGDYYACWAKCPDGKYFRKYRCATPDLGYEIDKSQTITYKWVTNYSAQKLIDCGNNAVYNTDRKACLRNWSLSQEQCEALGNWWEFYAAKSQCVKCMSSTQEFNHSLWKCVDK